MAIDARRDSETSRRANDLVEALLQVYEDFDYYKDTTYRNLARPAIFWPNGKSLGYGWASHMAGTAQKFYAKFQYWGFDDVEDFYCLPIEKRNEFLRNGKSIWKATFWHDEFQRKTAQDVLNIGRLDNTRLEQTLVSLTRAEHEFHNQLVEEAKRMKNECYKDRRLRWRIRNEKARFRAEDKLRERTQSSYCESCLTEEIWLQSFRLQERVKGLIGLRESFPKQPQ